MASEAKRNLSSGLNIAWRQLPVVLVTTIWAWERHLNCTMYLLKHWEGVSLEQGASQGQWRRGRPACEVLGTDVWYGIWLQPWYSNALGLQYCWKRQMKTSFQGRKSRSSMVRWLSSSTPKTNHSFTTTSVVLPGTVCKCIHSEWRKLGSIYGKLNLISKPMNVYNCDETGLASCISLYQNSDDVMCMQLRLQRRARHTLSSLVSQPLVMFCPQWWYIHESSPF